MLDYERIQKECFPEMSFSREELENIFHGNSFPEKKLLFQKILESSSRMLYDLQNFKIDDLSALLEDYTLPQFNRDYFFRRKNIVETFYFDKPMLVEELQWRM